MFEIGKKVVYPTLGVGEVEAIETKTFQDNEEEFYILRILSDNSMVMIPTNKAEIVGIRELISVSDVSKVFAFVVIGIFYVIGIITITIFGKHTTLLIKLTLLAQCHKISTSDSTSSPHTSQPLRLYRANISRYGG